MSWLAKLMVAALLAGYVPATFHCQLEFVPGLAFLACEEQPENAAPEDKHCGQDGCAAVESGACKVPDPTASVHPPPPPQASLAHNDLSDRDLSAPLAASVRSDFPPEPPRPWLFHLRAASLARAPTMIS